MKWLFSILIFSSIPLIGQDITLLGRVEDGTSIPIPYANIVVQSNDSTKNLLGYSYSDVNGNFSVNLSEPEDLLIINLTAVGFEEYSQVISTSRTTNDTFFTFVMRASLVDLNEVVVKARKIITDTLNLDIKEMNLSKDDNLEDILQKSAGVVVGDDGSIIYQGKKIKKININGKEVFVNQNKIALSNLKYGIMDSVQVIDNYKSKFSLDFNQIRDPIINIRTKEEFKGLFKPTMQAGAGHNQRYQFGGRGFYFSNRINTFITSDNNNFGRRNLSENDVTAQFEEYYSSQHNTILNPLFEVQNKARKNFSSNNSAILRLENEKNRTSGVLYYGNTKVVMNQTKNTFLSDSLLRTSTLTDEYSGNYLTGTVDRIQKLGQSTTIRSHITFFQSNSNNIISSLDSIFQSTTEVIGETTEKLSATSLIHGSLEINKVLSSNSIFSLNANLFHEGISENLKSELQYNTSIPIDQTSGLRKLQLSFNPRLEYKSNYSSFSAGIEFDVIKERGDIHFNNENYLSDKIVRFTSIYSIPLSYQRSYGKYNINLAISPMLIAFDEGRTLKFLKASNIIEYKFQKQNVLSVGYHRFFKYQDLDLFLENRAFSFNNILFSSIDLPGNVTVENDFSINWFNNKVSKSRMLYAVYELRLMSRFLQQVLTSVEKNKFIFSVMEFNGRQVHDFNIGLSKSFYLGQRFNKIEFASGLKLNYTSGPTIATGLHSNAISYFIEPSFQVRYTPRKSIIREIDIKTSYNVQRFSLNRIHVNHQSLLQNSIFFEGGKQKSDWNLQFYYTSYDVNGNTFNVPDINLRYQFNLTDHLSLFLEGTRVLTLLEINNFTSVETFSDGNLVTQLFNNNFIGYLMVNLSVDL